MLLEVAEHPSASWRDRAAQVQQSKKADDLYEKSVTIANSYFLSVIRFGHNDTVVPLTVLSFLGMRPDVVRSGCPTSSTHICFNVV